MFSEYLSSFMEGDSHLILSLSLFEYDVCWTKIRFQKISHCILFVCSWFHHVLKGVISHNLIFTFYRLLCLTFEEAFEWLGITIDDKLHWSGQISSANYSKANKRFHFVSKFRKFKINTLMTLFFIFFVEEETFQTVIVWNWLHL